MNCYEAQAAMQEALDGALAPDARTALTTHLAACGACRQAQAGLAATVASLDRAAEADRVVKAPAELMGRLGLATPAPVVSLCPRPRWLPAGMVAAAVALMLGVAVTVSRPAPEPPVASASADEAVAMTDAEWIHAWMGADELEDPLAF